MRLIVRGAYPADWPAIARAVKEAAQWRCIRCHHPDPRDYRPRGRHPCDVHCCHAPGKQRILTVHHLDGDKANVRWWNLLALCQACHLTVQARVLPTRPYLFPHSVWFVPYVCGFYASYYGGLEIPREVAEADPERWLVLGQPWLAGTAAARG